MGERIFADGAMTLSQAAKSVNPPVPMTTLARWADVGARGANGKRVVLETHRRGGRVLTSLAAIDRFIAALNERREPAHA